MKSQFFGHLETQHIEGPWERLLSPFGFYSARYDVTICGPTGFVLDFSSVPRLPGAYLIAGNTGKWKALPHDVGYRFGLLPRHTLDMIFFEAGQVRSGMRTKQDLLHRAGRLILNIGMTGFVIVGGHWSYDTARGCLDYRRRNQCHQKCRIDTTKCEYYYPDWRQCVMPGYHPEILKLHGG
jgi:hypothetical protein